MTTETNEELEGLEALAQEVVPPASSPAASVAAAAKKEAAAQRSKDREAGRQSLQAQLDSRAQALGYANAEELFANVGKPAVVRASEKVGDRGVERGSAEAAGLKKQVSELREEIRKLENVNRGLRSRVTSLESELDLRTSAYVAGVNPEDADVALSNLNTYYKKLPEEEQKSFNPDDFFGKVLREKRPSLFRDYAAAKAAQAAQPAAPRIEEVPITTSIPSVPADKVQNPTPPTQEERRDAMKLSPSEYRKHLEKLGISISS